MWDFVQARLGVTAFLEELRARMLLIFFIGHHDLARWQDEDWLKEKIVTSGVAAFVRDFAEGYTHLHRFEHQSKFLLRGVHYHFPPWYCTCTCTT